MVSTGPRKVCERLVVRLISTSTVGMCPLFRRRAGLTQVVGMRLVTHLFVVPRAVASRGASRLIVGLMRVDSTFILAGFVVVLSVVLLW